MNSETMSRVHRERFGGKRIGVLFALGLILVSTACEFGIFNKDYPDHSEALAYLNDDLDSALSKSMSLTFQFDDEKLRDKFVKLSLRHMKGENETKGGFTFSSETLPFTIMDEKTIVISLSKVNTLGIHQINAKSALEAKFDRSFLICVSSPIRTLDVDYQLEKTTEGISYDGADKGRFNTRSTIAKPIELVSSSAYAFSLSSESDWRIPTVDFSVEDSAIMRFEKESDTRARLVIEDGTAGTESSISIGMRNSDVRIDIPVLIKDIAEISIKALENAQSKTETICINDTESARNYAISLISASDENRSFLAYFTKQGNSEDISGGIPNSMRSAIVLDNNEHFSISFNGISRTISINPKKETVENGKNLHYYLYVFDANENYFGRWRILIGGGTESIKIGQSEIRVSTQSSSSVTASIDPPDESKQLLWYLSESKGEEDTPPPPLSKANQDNIITFLDKYATAGQIRIGNLTVDSSECSFGVTRGLDHTAHWTTGGEATALYMVAFDAESGKFRSVPFLISAEGGIALKCADPISGKKACDSSYDGNWAAFENGMRDISFPYGQSYPDTYAKGEHGSNARTFFLPHDKRSVISISAENIKTLTVSPTFQSNQLLSHMLFESENGGWELEITPVWLDLTERSKSSAVATSAPCQSSKAGMDAYGKIFYQYIGSCSLTLSACANSQNASETKIKLRIVLFED